MNPEESAAVTAIGEAIRTLNGALNEAHRLGLKVDIHTVTASEIGKPHDLDIYAATVSKDAFRHTVGG